MPKKLPNDGSSHAPAGKIQRHATLKPRRASDNSTVLTLLQPGTHTETAPSILESTLKGGHTTLLHLHRRSEECCYIIAGNGRVTVGDDWFQVRAGDTVQIPIGTPHKFQATGGAPLRMLLTSYPACSDDDFEILDASPKQEEPKRQSSLINLAPISVMTETKTTAKKTPKVPKLAFTTGPELKALRKKLMLNQSDFWRRIQVTQSGGSRYESGRNVPKPVALLLNLAYGTEKQSLAVMNYLRARNE